MNPTLIVRIIGLVILGSGTLALGTQLVAWFQLNMSVSVMAVISGIIGAGLGFFLTPKLVIQPFNKLRSTIQQLPAETLFSAIVGLFCGLVFGALASIPLFSLPSPLKEMLPFVCAAVFGYLGLTVATMRPDLFQSIRKRVFSRDSDVPEQKASSVLLDTSVIIDGRIADICRTGFIQGELIVPLFVLNELQHVADSPDTLRRNRGRRGLEILRLLQEESPVPVRLTEADAESVREVDDKLISLAKEMDASILTNDYNLNRVAELQGVVVLNVNELANAVKTVLLPGETFEIHVMQEGKEINQGVGYLDDGTMVVVEEGQSYIGQSIDVVVSKVLQTAAGRMIFARPGTGSEE